MAGAGGSISQRKNRGQTDCYIVFRVNGRDHARHWCVEGLFVQIGAPGGLLSSIACPRIASHSIAALQVVDILNTTSPAVTIVVFIASRGCGWFAIVGHTARHLTTVSTSTIIGSTNMTWLHSSTPSEDTTQSRVKPNGHDLTCHVSLPHDSPLTSSNVYMRHHVKTGTRNLIPHHIHSIPH